MVGARGQLHHHGGRREADRREPALLGDQRRHGHGQPDAAGGSADALQDRKPGARLPARARPRRPQRRHGHLQRPGLLRLGEIRQVPGRDRLGGHAPDHGAELHAQRSRRATAATPVAARPTTRPTTDSSSRPSSSTAWTSTARPTSGKWYWEVWNEWDYAGFWTGTEADYYTLYDNAVDAITAVLPNAEVGGPASTEPGKISRFPAALQDREQARDVRVVSRLPGRRRGGRGRQRHRPAHRQQHPR